MTEHGKHAFHERDDHGILVRPALASDVPHIQRLIAPYVDRRILLGKENVALYGSIQQFRIAEGPDGTPIGCGALGGVLGRHRRGAHARPREQWIHKRVGHRMLEALEHDARELGVARIFCLTFEVDFFAKHGYLEIGESVVSPDVYAELVRSSDEGSPSSSTSPGSSRTPSATPAC